MYTDINGDNWYKVQFHTHTTVSDGKRTPEQVAKIYKDAGFDIVAFTDHWRYQGERELSGIKVFSGCEYNFGTADATLGVMHIVGIGMDDEPALNKEICTRQDVINAIRAHGGLAVLAHPAWSLNTIAQVKALSGFEALEIYNTVSKLPRSRRPYSGVIVDLLANEGIIFPLTATDDAHYYEGEDAPISYIMVRAKSDSKEDILAAVRSCDFYASQGPQLSVTREGNKIIADCSECTQMLFLSNFVIANGRTIEGDAITHGEYEIKEGEKWIRVEVEDKNGKYAWSNIIKI